MSDTSNDNTNIIARNSFWYGLENSIDFIFSLFTSIAVARAMGPERLGYFAYINRLTEAARKVGGCFIPSATRKYMAEHLGRGDTGSARAIFYTALWTQTAVALVITAAGLGLAYAFADSNYQWVALCSVASLLPGMTVFVPSQANMAAENMAANVPGSLVASVTFLLVVILTLTQHWGLVGVAFAMLAMRTAELVARLVPALFWMQRLPRVPLHAHLARKMFVFSRQSLGLLLLTVLVWDSAEVLFLKYLCADLRQVAFYSLAFNITDRILVVPLVFAQATGATLMAQYGRDETQLRPMMSAAVRYLALVVLPLNLGMAVLSGPAVTIAYGSEFLPVIPILIAAALLAIPKAFLQPAQNLLEATENQGFLLRWMALACGVNLFLDWLLIPTYGALGAALAKGSVQLLAVAGLWAKVNRILRLEWPLRFLVRVGISSLAMTAVVLFLSRVLPPVSATFAGVGGGVLVFSLMLRLTGSLGSQDRQRLLKLRRQLPLCAQGWLEWGLGLLMPAPENRSPGA